MADRDLDAAIAVTRFGLGARPGEIAQARSDPRGFLKAQIRPAGAAQPQAEPESAQARLAEFRAYQQDRRAMKQAQGPDAPKPDPRDPVKMAQRMLREETGADFAARARLGAETPDGFAERWALFWANHFTVSATKLITATIVGPFEQEAIRPHVFGSFATLLGAAETHPAMLLYLDQAQSVGPGSPAAQVLKRGGGRGGGLAQAGGRTPGLNENLAREILELHTLGVNGGYSQADVTEFARAMTGLSVGGLREDPSRAGAAVFRAAAHEPGARTVLGNRYPEGGKEQAGAILADLAARPETARHICGKIARHFVADDPPPALTARLERRWRETGGDLAQVARALVEAPEAWDPAPAKFKTPYEFLISSWRAAGGAPRDITVLAPVLNAMGQKAFSAPSPKGWPEDAAAWTAPDAIVKRMAWAQAFAAAAIQDRDPRALAAQALGARLSPAAATAIARSETRAEGFALLLMSPEFQRR
ncbi:DUF1800 domain-containing protein [Phenylobacterium sp.]|uniref:DUF1800 domain-containing protein n=1 Tax=Phenylobacterium sp. TaxID=1871053 RepID=UPI003BAC654F